MPKHGQVITRLVDIGSSPDDCWQWIGHVSPSTGYGKRLARKFSVSPSLIHDIWNGRVWRNDEEAA